MFIGVIVVGKIFLSYILPALFSSKGFGFLADQQQVKLGWTAFIPSPLWVMRGAECSSAALAQGGEIGELAMLEREGLNLIKHLAPFIMPIGCADNTASDQRPAWLLYFKDIKSSKKDIYKQLKGKSGVYLFINNVNLNIYVGSSITLARRMAAHFHYATTSTSNNNQVLYRAMKKYNLENFSLAILEFCASDLEVCANLEQKWIDYYKPTYNVLKIARSSLGLKHSIDTIQKLKKRLASFNRQEKESHPKYGTISSIETRQAISEGIKVFYRNNPHKHKGKKGKLSPQYGIGGLFVFCYSSKTAFLPSPASPHHPAGMQKGAAEQGAEAAGKELIFPSINAARLYFKVRWATIKKIIDTPETLKFNNEE